MRLVIRLLSSAALFLSAAWFSVSPSYEPAITFLLGLAGILGSLFLNKTEHSSSLPPVQPTTELPVDRDTAAEMRLEGKLKEEGYRLFWGDVSKKEYYLHFGDYELIPWQDSRGRDCVLTNAPRGDLPLRTRFTSTEIEQRRKQRASGASNKSVDHYGSPAADGG